MYICIYFSGFFQQLITYQSQRKAALFQYNNKVSRVKLDSFDTFCLMFFIFFMILESVSILRSYWVMDYLMLEWKNLSLFFVVVLKKTVYFKFLDASEV